MQVTAAIAHGVGKLADVADSAKMTVGGHRVRGVESRGRRKKEDDVRVPSVGSKTAI